MEESALGPFTVVTFGPQNNSLGSFVVDTPRSAGHAWADLLATAPPAARSLAVYDREGTLVRLALRPAEALTDDADVSSMALSAAGTVVVTGHRDGDVRLWNVQSGELLWQHSPADEPVTGVALLERGPWVLAWCDDGPLLLLDRNNGEVITRIEDPQLGSFVVSAAPDGSEVACTGLPARRIGLPGGEPLPPLDLEDKPLEGVGSGEGESGGGGGPVPDDAIAYLAYLPDDATIMGVRAAESAEVVFWERATGARVATVPLEHDVAACDLSPNGALAAFVSGAEPTTVTFVDTRLRTISRSAQTGGRGALDARFVPDGSALVVHDEGAGVVVVDAASFEVRGRVAEEDGVHLVIARDEPVVPEERESAPIMVTRDLDGSLELTHLVSALPPGPVGQTLAREGTIFGAVPFATDNNYVALYDLARMRGLATLAHAGNVQSVWLSADAGRVAVHAAGHVTVWTLPSVPPRG